MTINELMQDSKYKSYINVVVIYLERRFGIEIPLNVNLFNDRFEVKYGDYVSSYISHNAREYIKIRNRYGIIFINLYKCNTAEKVAETLIHEFTHYKQDVYNTIDRNHIVSTKGYDKDVCEDEAINESKIFGMMLNIIIPKIDPYTITYEDLVHTVSDYVYSLDKE